MKALAIDIETTGLDPNLHSMTEFAAVFFDTHDKSVLTKSFHRWLYPQGFFWDAFCLNLHSNWIKEVLERYNQKKLTGEPVICTSTKELIHDFTQWMFHECDHPLPREGKWEKVTAAGKNFGSFDSQFLIRAGFPAMFRHRSLDPTALYVDPIDPFPPELALCKERAVKTGCTILRPGVAHTALEDAMDVAILLQHGFSL